MASNTQPSWLEVLEKRMNIDVDWMDPGFIKSLPFKPHDQTSNQLWQGIQLSQTSNAELLATTVKEFKNKDWLAVYTKMGTLMCKENIDLIQGRVLVQTSPSFAYDSKKIVEHARQYDQEFKQRGISRERFCIKILTTGPGVTAMRILAQEGIPVLGTAVFSVEQAIACSQAGCLYISPYYNEVRAHEDPSLWPNVQDPATEHWFSNRIYQMTDSYKRLYEKTGKEQPLIKLAAFRSIKEVIAAAELGCHSATLSPQTLEQLATAEYDSSLDLGEHHVKLQPRGFYAQLPPPSARLKPLLQSDPLKKGTFEPVKIDVDYVADDAAELVKALENDPEGLRRLEDAIALFIPAEEASKTLIESVIQQSS